MSKSKHSEAQIIEAQIIEAQIIEAVKRLEGGQQRWHKSDLNVLKRAQSHEITADAE